MGRGWGSGGIIDGLLALLHFWTPFFMLPIALNMLHDCKREKKNDTIFMRLFFLLGDAEIEGNATQRSPVAAAPGALPVLPSCPLHPPGCHPDNPPHAGRLCRFTFSL